MGVFVYLIYSPTLNAVKIGVANDIWRRLDELQVGTPDKLQLLHAIECINRKSAFNLERSLHRKYDKKRTRGEWFNLNPLELKSEIGHYLRPVEYKECGTEKVMKVNTSSFAGYKSSVSTHLKFGMLGLILALYGPLSNESQWFVLIATILAIGYLSMAIYLLRLEHWLVVFDAESAGLSSATIQRALDWRKHSSD